MGTSRIDENYGSEMKMFYNSKIVYWTSNNYHIISETYSYNIITIKYSNNSDRWRTFCINI